jgi:site-specific DNA-methyltransferase (adenine-specific)
MKINKIYNENCFDTFSRMEDNSVDVVFTSPPYNRKRNDKYEFYDDQIVDYYGFLREVVEQSIRVSRGNVYLNIMKNYYNKSDVFKLIGEFSDKIYDIFIWEKSNPLPASGKSITNAYEFIIVFGESLKSNTTYTKNHITTSVAQMRKNHKAIMNPKVAEFFIEKFTQEGDIIYDPFMGCGTTAIVSKKLNRYYIGSEIVKEYCDISEKELQPLTPKRNERHRQDISNDGSPA